jgi:hypothetical protein
MNWNKTLSGLLAVAYIVVALVHDGAKTAFVFAIFLMLPLGCIWFSDAMGGYKGGFAMSAPITYPSPGFLVRIVGWVLLLLPIVLETIMNTPA